jgi:Xaa-Pro aminopeptidase
MRDALVRSVLLVSLLVSWTLPASAQNAFPSRRAALAQAHPRALIILPARWEEKAMEQPAWIQEPNFFYFTGLADAPGAILVIDTASGAHIFFAGPTPEPFGIAQPGSDLMQRPDWIAASGIDAVLPMERFAPYIRHRLDAPDGPDRILLNTPRFPLPQATPDDMLVVSGFHALWEQSLRAAFPDASFGTVAETVDRLRWTKSEAEIAHLRCNGRASAEALKAGMRSVRAGESQRKAEAAVVAACLENGMEGPSFWPWVMGGPNAHIARVVGSFHSSTHLNRTYQPGELVRVDIGCMSGGYGGDVGRTVPVTGTWTAEQAHIWDLLILGYRAGVAAMRSGVSLESIEEAARDAIRTHGGSNPSLAEELATGILWHIHGVGVESGESPGEPVLRAGTVLAFEPMFSRGEDAYYLEDMWLITDSGVELLTPGLPTTSTEIASFLSR